MKRKITSDLMAWKDDRERKPLILRGARQVGKTYILQEFGRTAFPKCHYINFENDERLIGLFEKDFSPTRIVDELQFYLNATIDTSRDLLILDEIQQCPRALTALKYFCEEMRHFAVCAAGSLLGIGLGTESFPVGKVTFLDLYPLNFEEFLDGIGQERLVELFRTHDVRTSLPEVGHDRLWEYWKRYCIVGGLPEVVKTYGRNADNQYEALQLTRGIQRNLVDAYLADIAKHAGKTNAMHIERLFRNVPAQLARSQTGSAPKFRFKDAVPGLRGYERLRSPLDWLERARLVHRSSIVNRAEIPLASFLKENRFKQYFFDVGLLGSVSNIDPAIIMQYDYGSYKGYMAENFVAQELISAGVRSLYCWEGRTSEVEFLLETPLGIVPLEVKSGWVTQSKSLKVFQERYHPPLSVIFSARNGMKEQARWYLPVYMSGRLPSITGV
jgi:predicted AAA+ superfamily ATPase